jgi:hypothetical protein
MNDNIKAGSDIHAGDGGYSIGTQEKYDEFVKGRNESLVRMRMEDLMYKAGLTAQGCWDEMDSYDRQAIEKLIELVIKDCIGVVENMSPGYDDYRNQIEDAFRRDCVEEMKFKYGINDDVQTL